MSLLSSVTRLAKTDSKWYLFLGVLSALKAVGLRHDRVRCRRELLDAGMFLAIGLALRKVEGRRNRYRSKVERFSSKKSATESSAKAKKAKARAKAESVRRRINGERKPETAVESLVRRFSESSGGSSKTDSLRARFTR